MGVKKFFFKISNKVLLDIWLIDSYTFTKEFCVDIAKFKFSVYPPRHSSAPCPSILILYPFLFCDLYKSNCFE